MLEKNFSTNVREIVNNSSHHPKSYSVIPQSNNKTMFVVTNSIDLKDMESLAEAFCKEDFLVSFVKDSNFLVVEENPYQTQKSPNIIRIPISFEEAIEKLAEYTENVEIVLPNVSSDGVTVVAKNSGIRSTLTEIAFLLSACGMYVTFVEGCNFLVFKEVQSKANTNVVAVSA